MTKLLMSKNSFLFCEGGIQHYVKIIVLLCLYFLAQTDIGAKMYFVSAIAFLNTETPIEWALNFTENISDDVIDIFNLTDLLHISNVKVIIAFAMIGQLIRKIVLKKVDTKESVFWCCSTIMFLLSSLCTVFAPTLCVMVGFISIVTEFLGNVDLFKDNDNKNDEKETIQTKRKHSKENDNKITVITIFITSIILINKKLLIYTKENYKPPPRWFIFYKKDIATKCGNVFLIC